MVQVNDSMWHYSVLAFRIICPLLIEFVVSNAFFSAVQINPYRSRRIASTLPRKFVFQPSSKKYLIPQPTQMMIRNIDLPEAVVLYGTKILAPTFVADNVVDAQTIQIRKGLEKLLEECHSIKAVVVLLLDNENLVAVSAEQNTRSYQRILLEKVLGKEIFKRCQVFVQTVAPPNPTDLISFTKGISVQPRPYGGSATIGYSRAADPERLVDPKHCVVITSTVDQTRIARALGMRVVSINPDDDLADAVLMDYDDNDSGHVSMHITVDDIATPGSFWLNPPHPRDDFGNRVDDPFKTLLRLPDTNQIESIVDYDDEESHFQAILNDIAPLYE
jgi:beta-phosphoglucomutase-like phosphatase (HAD superfamily)